MNFRQMSRAEESSIVLHLNIHGMVLHMDYEIGTQNPFHPKRESECIGRTLSDIFPDNKFGENILPTIKLALDYGPWKNSFTFPFELRESESVVVTHSARITYLRPDTVLFVSSKTGHYRK